MAKGGKVYNFQPVPNQRKKGQTLVAFPLDDQFLAEMDRARGEMNRSAFVREAIYQLLKERGIDLPPSIKAAPDRVGKGGRPRKVVDMVRPEESSKVAEDSVPHVPKPTTKPTPYPKGRKGK